MNEELITTDGEVTGLQITGDAFVTPVTKEEIEGGHIFNSKSCYSCHTGSNFGGQMIQKLGIVEEWPNQNDLGYYHIKKLSPYINYS